MTNERKIPLTSIGSTEQWSATADVVKGVDPENMDRSNFLKDLFKVSRPHKPVKEES